MSEERNRCARRTGQSSNAPLDQTAHLLPGPGEGYRSTLFNYAAGGLVALVWLLASLGANAHGGATGIVKQRMDAMSELGDASEIIGDMVKRKRPLDPVEVRRLALQMSEHAAGIPELFPDTPESREGRATEALPAIWSRWEEFQALTVDLERESAALAEVAQGEDARAIRKQFVAVAKTCRGCHTEFRRPKDD